ncbi:hypothetical protein JCM10908_006899 [Rhodotorula pacifica]|uniref:FRA10AC1 family protein n=1 Tax=Rhodotorula pacifica TaxID=1495444 RepID=UPI0031820843
MDRRYSGSSSYASTSRSAALPAAPSSKRRKLEIFEPPNAHDRLQRMHALKQFYESSGERRMPAKPRSRHDLDVLRERHQFVRDSRVDPATLSWEDQLASKFYDSLFKEYAVVNLKHYKTGAVALRWRTEDEVLSGIGHLTCGSLRCQFHEPSSSILDSLANPDPDPDSETPLVETRLEELEMPFGYMEEGVKKTALVKVVLCRECGKKLRYGKEKAKEEREKRSRLLIAAAATPSEAVARLDESETSRSNSRSGRASSPIDERASRRRRADKQLAEAGDEDHDDKDGDDSRPELPPDLAERRKTSSGRERDPRTSERRRSASPRRRESHRRRRSDSS